MDKEANAASKCKRGTRFKGWRRGIDESVSLWSRVLYKNRRWLEFRRGRWNYVPKFRSDGTQITPDGTPGHEFHRVPTSLLEFHRVPRSKFHVPRFTRNLLEPTTFCSVRMIECELHHVQPQWRCRLQTDIYSWGLDLAFHSTLYALPGPVIFYRKNSQGTGVA